MASSSTNSFLVGNQTHLPSFKPQSFLNLTKPTTLNITSTRTKPLSIRCAGSDQRVINFAAGPAALPENVLLKAQSDLYNWRGSGMSVTEMSHRGKDFLSIIQKAESDLRNLLHIPSHYIVTGSWGDKAKKYCNPKVVWSGKADKYTKVPSRTRTPSICIYAPMRLSMELSLKNTLFLRIQMVS